MKTTMINQLSILQNKIKAAYEESVKGNCEEAKDLLFDSLIILSKATDNADAPKTKKHKWSVDDEIVGFYLASKYSDTSSFRNDQATKKLVKVRQTISLGSLQMLIQNFYYLMKKDNGLGSASKLAKEVHAKYKHLSLSELSKVAEMALKRLGSGGK